jgi:hypothetical protein
MSPTLMPTQLHSPPVGRFPPAGGSPQLQFQHQQPAMVPRLSPQLKPVVRSPSTANPEKKGGVGIFFQQDASGFTCVASMSPDGPAARDGRLRLGDELVGVNNIPIGQQTPILDLRELILGDPGTHVLLALRRPGGMHGDGDPDDFWYYEAELERDSGGGAGNQRNDSRNVQRTGAPAMQRSVPSPPGNAPAATYRNEIAHMRAQVDDLRFMQSGNDPRLQPLEDELQERMNDLQRFEGMYQDACEQLRVHQNQHQEVLNLFSVHTAGRSSCCARSNNGVFQVKDELTRLEDENQMLQVHDRERSSRFEDLHRESGSHLGRLDTGLGTQQFRHKVARSSLRV